MAGETFFITAPVFLKRLLSDFCEEKIELICIKETIQDDHQIENNVEDLTIGELDLTGTPLQVPLEDDSVDVTLLLDRPSNWSKNEACYHPLKVDAARKLLNSKLQQCQLDIPRYGLCDGNDNRHIILVGANRTAKAIIRTIACIQPSELADDVIFSEEYIRKLTFFKIPNLQVEYSLRKLYLLYGPNTLNESSGCNGQIKIGLRAASGVLEQLCSNKTLTMELKVVIGDPKSDLYDCWSDFCTLYRYFDSTINGTLTETIFSNNPPLDDKKPVDELKNLFVSHKSLNSNEFWSKLWKILKDCNDFNVLQDCIKSLMIQSIENPSVKSILEEATIVSRLLTMLIERKFEIPTKQQCFGLLIEIGFEKLKQDYCTILDRYAKLKHRSILQRLCEFRNDSYHAYLINPTTFKSKLWYLYLLQMIAESLLFYEKTLKLSKISLDNFIGLINRTLSVKIGEFGEIQLSPQIFECCFELNTDDFNIVQTLLPYEVQIQFTTKSKVCERNTIYFYSECPPIPNIDYNTKEFQNLAREYKNKMFYYVTKLERVSDQLPIFIRN